MQYRLSSGAGRFRLRARLFSREARYRLVHSSRIPLGATAIWAHERVTRRARLLALVGGAALAATLMARTAPHAPTTWPWSGGAAALSTPAPALIGPADVGSLLAPPALPLPASEAVPGPGSPLPALGASDPASGLVEGATPAAALALADTLHLRRLEAQMAAPSVQPAASATDLAALTQLVQQAQVTLPQPPALPSLSAASMGNSAPAANGAAATASDASGMQASTDASTKALADATKAVQDAQAALVAALGATPSAAPTTVPVAEGVATAVQVRSSPSVSSSSPASSDGVSATSAPLAGVSAAVSVPAGTPVPPAVLQSAQSELDRAQAALAALVAPASKEAIGATEKAMQEALAATPPAPGKQALDEAEAAVAKAQQEYDIARQGPSQEAIAQAQAAVATAEAEARSPQTAIVQAAADPTPVTAPSSPALTDAQNNLDRLLHGPDPRRLADTALNLQQAQARLAELRLQDAYAKNPESQPTAMAARQQLAALLAPPDRQKVADAQAVVTAAQQRLDALAPASVTPASASPQASAGSPLAAPGPGSLAASTVPPAAATPQAVSSPTGHPAAPPEAGAPDAVQAASDRLAAAQAHLREVVIATTSVAPQPAVAPAAAPTPDGTGGSAAASQVVAGAGTSMTRVTPAILAAQNRVVAGEAAGAGGALTASVGLRALFVRDAALLALHLHPAAFAVPAAPSLPAALTGSRRLLVWPSSGPITQPFGVPELGVGSPHTGIDIGLPVGTPVRAAAGGVVIFAGGDPRVSYGYYVLIDHGGGVSTLYGHLALPPFVLPGQSIAQGSLLGMSGSTGTSTGPHLHFEVRSNGAPVNPLRVLTLAAP